MKKIVKYQTWTSRFYVVQFWLIILYSLCIIYESHVYLFNVVVAFSNVPVSLFACLQIGCLKFLGVGDSNDSYSISSTNGLVYEVGKWQKGFMLCAVFLSMKNKHFEIWKVIYLKR